IAVPSGWDPYTAVTSSRVMVAESWSTTPARQWSRTASGTSEEAHTTTSARAGADEGDHRDLVGRRRWAGPEVEADVRRGPRSGAGAAAGSAGTMTVAR